MPKLLPLLGNPTSFFLLFSGRPACPGSRHALVVTCRSVYVCVRSFTEVRLWFLGPAFIDKKPHL